MKAIADAVRQLQSDPNEGKRKTLEDRIDAEILDIYGLSQSDLTRLEEQLLYKPERTAAR